jgi:acyl-ACP thioesterase
MYIEVEKYPAWQDEITLNTWSAGTDGMYAFREFILTDKSGGLILRASSAWLILDMENKRVFG